jgi:transposase
MLQRENRFKPLFPVSPDWRRDCLSVGMVAPKLMGVSRRGEREPGKSDQIDARAIARAVLREGIGRFPTAYLDENAVEIRLLCDHRDTLVNERTRLINRLRINLVILDPEFEAKIPSRKLDYPGQLQRVTRRLRSMPQTARVRIAREQTLRIGALTREAEMLKRELRDLIRAQRPELLEETGCGPLTAAILIGQTAGAERFKSDAHFARLAGVAPIPVSSGRHDRHRLDRGGNRQINRALHIIAITRGRLDPETRAYLQRKEAEGKTRMEAMRCLKRHLARRYHRLLLRPPRREHEPTHQSTPPAGSSSEQALLGRAGSPAGPASARPRALQLCSPRQVQARPPAR